MSTIRWIQEAGHFAPLLPLGFCVLLTLRGKNPAPDVWLLTCAFLVSFVSDQFAAYLQARRVHNLWLMYIHAPIQFGLFAAILANTRKQRIGSIAAIAALAMLSPFAGNFNSVEMLTQVGGGAVVGVLVYRQREQLGAYVHPLWIYCVASILPLAIMAGTAPSISGPWFIAWVVYQGLRVAALLSMTYAIIWQPHLRLEVSDGHRAGETAAQRWSAFGVVGSGDRHAVASARRAGAI